MKVSTHGWKGILLGLILLLGLALRVYNLNFPSIGYHNLKENEYLSMAQEMERTNDFISRRIYYENAFQEEPTMVITPQPPLISYQILISWKILGNNLWGPRLFNALLGAASIFLIYLIAGLLFKRKHYALLCAFLSAIMPLGVFFSRNLQPESPAFFFMLLGNLFYLRFAASFKKYNLVLGGLSFSVASLYKLSFLIGILPFIFCFPFKALFKEKKEFLKLLSAFCLPYLVIIAVIIWLANIGQWKFEAAQTLNRIKLWVIFTHGYWEKSGRIIWWYTKGENYTYVYTVLALMGIIAAFFRRKLLLNRYIIGWAAACIPYSMVFSDFINQHNYYQMPFLGLICISSTYAIVCIAETVTIKGVAQNIFLSLLMIITIAGSSPLVYHSIARMYGTVFWGLDVAGESLGGFTKPGERVFLLTHAQGYGLSRYARRYVGWEPDVQAFKEKERKFNVRYVCFYPAEFARSLKESNAPLFEYIQNNYHVKEVGITDEPANIFYLILEKGEGSDPKTFLQSFNGTRQLRTIYKPMGKYIFFYSLRPTAADEAKK